MRITVLGESGVLAASPEEALEGLAQIAEADGADREDWLAKARGATHVHERRGSRFRSVNEFSEHAQSVYDKAMAQAVREIEALLQDGAEHADTHPFHR